MDIAEGGLNKLIQIYKEALPTVRLGGGLIGAPLPFLGEAPPLPAAARPRGRTRLLLDPTLPLAFIQNHSK